MKIVVSVTDPGAIEEAERAGADVIEIRRDLMQGNPLEQLRQIRKRVQVPWIGTIRTLTEGGRFSGSPEEWRSQVEPLLPLCAMIDMEYPCRKFADEIRAANKTIIASFHMYGMPPADGLAAIEKRLRSYGDIPKIVVQPGSEQELLSLLSFILGAERPVIVSTKGRRFRFARALLSLFGSEMVFCHTGTPTGEGQYHINEFRELIRLMGAGEEGDT